MTDIPQLVEKILSDPKIAASRNFSSRTYEDEPILFPASRKLRDFTPPRIREMRLLARKYGYGTNENNPKLFYEQGKFMEAFEDDHDCPGEFIHYFPTYQSMTDAQLRGYFSWRTKLRRGTLEQTSLSFAFVYIYELLNQIGVPSPLDGFHMLKRFWTEYRELDPRITRYVPVWLKDYALYHDLDKSLLGDLPDAGLDEATATLLNLGAHSAAEVFAALAALSAYDLKGSKLYALHPADVEECVHRVFSAVVDYYGRDPKKSAAEKLFGKFCSSAYFLFNSAVFHDRIVQKDRDYAIGGNHVYRCREGEWTCERFVWYGRNNKRIGDILKTLDYFMRRSRGIKSALLPGKTNKVLTAKIEKAVALFEEEKRSRPNVDIDVSKLQAIRTASIALRDKLLVDEQLNSGTLNPGTVYSLCNNEYTVPGLSPGLSVPELSAELNEEERLFLRCLLYNEPYEELLRTRGLMASLLMDGINEKLFDVFSDTVLVDGAAGPEILEDYREDLKGMLPA